MLALKKGKESLKLKGGIALNQLQRKLMLIAGRGSRSPAGEGGKEETNTGLLSKLGRACFSFAQELTNTGLLRKLGRACLASV